MASGPDGTGSRDIGGSESDVSAPRETLAGELVETLRAARETLAVAESCTGGGLGALITGIAGASHVFWGGVIAYRNAAKVDLLRVDAADLEQHGAVSREVAVAMAEGVRRVADATWGASITGIAGPSGGTPDKPVGTVWFAVDGPRTSSAVRRFPGDRAEIRARSVDEAISLLLAACAVGDNG